MSNFKEKIESLLPEGLILLDLIQDDKRQGVRVIIDGKNPMDLTLTTNLARQIKDEAIFEAVYPNGYQLEVSSPGIDAPLRHPFQFEKNINRKIKVVENVGDNPVSLVLVSADESGFEAKNRAGDSQRYDYDHVHSVQVLIDFK